MARWCAMARQGAGDGRLRRRHGHPARDLLRENGIEDDGDLILRRVQSADGRTRPIVNDQPVCVAADARRPASCWSRSMASTTTARWSIPMPIAPARCLRRPCRRGAERRARSTGAGSETERTLKKHRAKVEAAAREADYLRASVDELEQARPQRRRGGRARRAPRADDGAERSPAISTRRSEFLNGKPRPCRISPRWCAGSSARARRRPGCLKRPSSRSTRRSTSLDDAQIGSRGGAARHRIRSEGTGARRGAAVCAARRRPQIFRAGRRACRHWPRHDDRRPCRSRCRRGEAEAAGNARLRPRRGALSMPRPLQLSAKRHDAGDGAVARR